MLTLDYILTGCCLKFLYAVVQHKEIVYITASWVCIEVFHLLSFIVPL